MTDMAERPSLALVFDDRVETRPHVRETMVRGPEAGEVRVRMQAAGVCHSDLHAINGDWPIGQRVVLGHEGAGIVDAVGPDVTAPAVGDLVALNWYAPCRACGACRRDRPWLCSSTPAAANMLPGAVSATREINARRTAWPYLGVGAFAQFVVVPAHAAVAIPADVPAEVAAVVGCSVTTGYGAVVHTAAVRPGETAVVVGCGGVGQAILMTLVLGGAERIVAVDRSPAKLEAARRLGATDLVAADGTEREQLRELLPEGADVAFDAIGVPAVAGYLPQHVTAGGRCILVGMPRIDGTAEVNTWDLVTRGVSVVGCNYGSSIPSRDFPAVAALYLDRRLALENLLGPRVSLADTADAIRGLATHEGGRILVNLAD